MDGEGRTSEFNHVCEVCHPGSGVVCWKCLGVVIREGWGLLVLRGCLHWEIFPMRIHLALRIFTRVLATIRASC